jgi:hypothetical protein
MAATKSQGKAFGLFMVGLTTAAAGIAYLSSGSGVAALIVGLIVVAISFGFFLAIKPQEGKVPDAPQPLVLKLAGIVASLGGWLIVLVGMHMTSSVSGRMTAAVAGIVVSLFGILYLLPAAANKNAIWKA